MESRIVYALNFSSWFRPYSAFRSFGQYHSGLTQSCNVSALEDGFCSSVESFFLYVAHTWYCTTAYETPMLAPAGMTRLSGLSTVLRKMRFSLSTHVSSAS